MKWFFACNDKSPEFFPLIEGAVNSALQNTSLVPYFIYDGIENNFTEKLRGKGVNVINHRVSFYDELEKHYDEKGLAVASGAFLRCDIPIIETEDEFVLYTDCDVLFLKDFECELKPEYFACSSQTEKNNFRHFNTGVMLMNTKKLRESHQEFCNFIVKNLDLLTAYDQTAYQIFYSNKNTKLDPKYNHKPYWGKDKNAIIIHFHGSKPTTFTSEENIKNMHATYYNLYKKNPEAYDFYLNVFKNYYPKIQYDLESMEKLKSGMYPIDKRAKSPLLKRLKHRLIKEYKIFLQKF